MQNKGVSLPLPLMSFIVPLLFQPIREQYRELVQLLVDIDVELSDQRAGEPSGTTGLERGIPEDIE